MERLRRDSEGSDKPAVEKINLSRVPPHQILTDKFPIMTFDVTPNVSISNWRLRLFGQVESEVVLDWKQFLKLAQTPQTKDFHCVTQWSHLDVDWEGVRASVVLDLCIPLARATHAMVHCYDGYCTNIDLVTLREPATLFAHTQFGLPLAREHGSPVRLLVPNRYGWKSAKWVRGVEFMDGDHPGFWEEQGYHSRGEIWSEQRFTKPSCQ